MIADHPQDGSASFQRKHRPRVPSGAKLEVVSFQTPEAKPAVQMRLAKRLTQLRHRLDQLRLSLSRQAACFPPEAGSELNP